MESRPVPSREGTLALEAVIARARRRRKVWGPLASTWVPMLVSAVIHAGLLATLGLIVWRVVLDPAVLAPEVRVSFDDVGLGDAPPSPLPPPLPAETTPPEASAGTPPPPTTVSKPTLAGFAESSTAEPTPADPRADSATSTNPSADDANHDGSTTTHADTAALGSLTGLFDDASPLGAPGTETAPPVSGRPVAFGGLGSSSARSVVYVVDASGPMVTSLPLVIAAVERSVARLSPSQKFGVVLFRTLDSFDAEDAPPNGERVGTELFTPILVRATPLAKQRLSAWLKTIKPMGRSNPLDGLEHALALKPEAVFLLSRSINRTGGGVWDQGLDATLDRLDQLNPVGRWSHRRPVVIKTIQFVDEDPTGIMQAIGEQHSPSPQPGTPAAKSDRGYTVVKRAEDL